jgi:hypothetical protein
MARRGPLCGRPWPRMGRTCLRRPLSHGDRSCDRNDASRKHELTAHWKLPTAPPGPTTAHYIRGVISR